MRTVKHTTLLLLAMLSLFTIKAYGQAYQASVYDVVDGKIVARVTRDGMPLSFSDGLSWDIISGQALVSEDPLTKVSLFKPNGTVPVVAVPHVGNFVGPPVRIGIDPTNLPLSQRRFQVAGGGSCVGNTQTGIPLTVDVRSVMTSNVIPLSLTERELVYRNCEYYAFDHNVGPMRITLNPDYRSQTVLTSQQSTGQNFFPATAESRFFFNIDFLDSGLRVFNKEPMTFLASSTQWPPFETALEHEAPVAFYLADAPDTQFMTIQNQYMSLYPTTELDISTLQFAIDDDLNLDAVWRITNTSNSAATLRWFLLGNLGIPDSDTFGPIDIGPAGSLNESVNVTFHSQLTQSTLTQFLMLGAVSQDGPRLTGSTRVDYLLSVPEPSSIIVCGFGAIYVLGYIRRNRKPYIQPKV